MVAGTSGPEFEVHALQIARAIYDPLGLQGAIMFENHEHDGVFIGDDAINAFEFTTSRQKDKAVKDAEKLRRILKNLASRSEHRYKSIKGWFVTLEEPTAEQRLAVETESKKHQVPIFAISIVTLQKRTCDTEGYLRARDAASFGSTAYTEQSGFPLVNIPPRFRQSGDLAVDTAQMATSIVSGERVLLVGEFGVGKSFALRTLYQTIRKRYFKSAGIEPFPLHINLKDCVGLRSPAEILRRHAEEIGFDGERGLISAWRAGACTLLLDGFDEVAPTRWMGGASDLKQVRWQALAPIRKLISEAPAGTGAIVCGRSHFFSSQTEMLETLGFSGTSSVYEIDDFSEDQLKEYLDALGASTVIPDWIPNRPLLLGYLYSAGLLAELANGDSRTQGEAWIDLLASIAEREAKMYSAVRPETISRIISRVATLARARGNELGPVGMSDMQQAFYNINGYKPDEEGIQLLLRLPGLAVSASASDEDEDGGGESRIFVDRSLAAAAYGEDLASYIANFHDTRHPLSNPASWVTAGIDLSIDVAAASLRRLGTTRRAMLAAADSRQSHGLADAVVADLVRTIDSLYAEERGDRGYLIDGVLFEYLSLDNAPVLSKCRIKDCVIDILDFNGVTDVAECPSLEACIIGFADGVAAIPGQLLERFMGNTQVEEFSTNSQTTAGILRLPLSPEIVVALTVLKKVYSQRGAGRKENALYRGLDQQRQRIVPEVISRLMSDGWFYTTPAGGTIVYHAAKGRRAQALSILDAPSTFKFQRS